MIGRLPRGGSVRAAWAALALGVVLAGCSGATPGTAPASGTAGTDHGPRCGLSTYPDGHQVVRTAVTEGRR